MSSSSTRPPTQESPGSISRAEQAITRRRFAGLAGLAGATMAAGPAPGTHLQQLIRGREDIDFGYEFAVQAGKKLPEDVVDSYVRLVSNRESLRGSLAFYRAWDETVAQNAQRKNRPLTMPVLAALTPFLAPYRDASAAAHTPRPRAAAASLSLG